MNQSLDSVFHYYQTTINLRSYRQEVLASNVANVDTPGFKARDFEFGSALDHALTATGASSSGGRLSLSDEAPATPAGTLALTAPMQQTGTALLAATQPGHMGEAAVALDPVTHAIAQSVAKLQYAIPSQDSIDGNTVDMDVERAKFANNAIHYEANLTQLTGQIKDLIQAMQSA